MLSRVVKNISICNLDNRDMLREMTVKIGLERIDIQEGVIVEALLDNGAMRLVMSSEFARKQGFKLKRIENPIYIRNVDGIFNKKRPIENMVEVNVYYQKYRERTEIDIIGEQKWNVILGMPQLAHHNPKIDWRTVEVKIMRRLREYERQQRPKQGKSGQQKQKEEEKREEARKKQKEREKRHREEKKNGSKESSKEMEDLG